MLRVSISMLILATSFLSACGSEDQFLVSADSGSGLSFYWNSELGGKWQWVWKDSSKVDDANFYIKIVGEEVSTSEPFCEGVMATVVETDEGDELVLANHLNSCFLGFEKSSPEAELVSDLEGGLSFESDGKELHAGPYTFLFAD